MGDYEESGSLQAIPAQSQVTQASAGSIAAPSKKGLDLAMVTPKLVSLVKDVLVDDDNIDLDDPFMEAGIDSLGSVQLLTDVGKHFQMTLSPSAIFDYPTVRSLAEFLVGESAGAAAPSGGGGDEWEEYEDWTDVEEDDDGDYEDVSTAIAPAATKADAPTAAAPTK